MTLEQIKEKINTPEYGFIRDDANLGKNIILLGLSGSHAYGTDNEDSDLDIRGIALNSREDILAGSVKKAVFEQFVDENTDTTIYSFNKIIKLLIECNPNTVEMLGLKNEHYLMFSGIGQELLDNKKIFLSKKACHSFAGYANQQLYRLTQKAAGHYSEPELEEHMLKTLKNMQESFKDRYAQYDDDGIKLYIDKAVNDDYETEIFMDIALKHYPIRDYRSFWAELNNAVKSYAKIGKRNQHAIEHNKLGKHMMHLVRLYYMCFDILERGEIITYREKEHDFLMSVRNGAFLDGNGMPTDEFSDLVNELERRFEYDKENTSLPEVPDYNKIYEFVSSVNECIVNGL